MKLFTNKLTVLFMCCLFAGACSSKQEEVSAQEPIEETVVVEVPAEAPKVEIPAPSVEPKEITTPTPKPTTTRKTLYPNEVLNQLKDFLLLHFLCVRQNQ